MVKAAGAKQPWPVLKAGRSYRIGHRRKGFFVAKLIEERDAELLVQIDTSEGAGHEHLANVRVRDAEGNKTTPAVTEKLLLRSLIVSMEEANGFE